MKHRNWYAFSWLTFAFTLPAVGGVIQSHFLDLVIPVHFTGDARILAGSVSNNPFFGGVALVECSDFQLVLDGPQHAEAIEKLATGQSIDGGGPSFTFHERQESRFGRKPARGAAKGNRANFTGGNDGPLTRNWGNENGGGSLTMVGVHVETQPQLGGLVVAGNSTNSPPSESQTHGDPLRFHRGILVLSTLGPITHFGASFFGGVETAGHLGKVRNQRMDSAGVDYKLFGMLSVSTGLAIGHSQGASISNNGLSLDYLATYSSAKASDLTSGENSNFIGDIKDDYTMRIEVILNLVELGTHMVREIWHVHGVHSNPGDG